MKTRISVFMLSILGVSYLSAQGYQELKVETNAVVNMSAQESWRVTQDWENLNKLVPEVVESTTVNGHGLGSTWKIVLKNGGQITEQMVYYNPDDRIMSYIMTETPMPIEDYTAIIKVEAYGISKSLITFFTSCKTTKDNAESISSAFKAFQKKYLSNIENQTL